MSVFRGVRKLPPAHRLVFQEGALCDRALLAARLLGQAPRSTTSGSCTRRSAPRCAPRSRGGSSPTFRSAPSSPAGSTPRPSSRRWPSSRREPVKTFSIGFADEAFNELPRARLVAERFATDHHELVVEPDAVELLPKLVRHYGEPFGDHSALPCFYLAELAREHVTVALNGDGGDESFAGYQRYTSNMLAARLEGLPAPLRRAIAAAGARLAGRPSDPRTRRSRVAALRRPPRRRAARALPAPGERLRRRRARRPSTRRSSPRDRCAPATPTRSCSAPGARPAAPSCSISCSRSTRRVYLPGDLLPKIDIATMAFSLEARSPLLDHELMELAASIPARATRRSGAQRKIALRGALRGWLPDAILDGRKQGFELPVARWLRTDLAPFTREVLLDRESAERGWMRPEAVEALIDRARRRHRRPRPQLWSLLTLELWAQSAMAAAPRRDGRRRHEHEHCRRERAPQRGLRLAPCRRPA